MLKRERSNGEGRRFEGDDGVSCPVCWEPYWNPSTAHPCGHVACRACFARVVLCPLCRSDIERVVLCGDPLRAKSHNTQTSCSCCPWTGSREEQMEQGHVVCPVECRRQAAAALDAVFLAYHEEKASRPCRDGDTHSQHEHVAVTPFLRHSLLEACGTGALHLAIGLILYIQERKGDAPFTEIHTGGDKQQLEPHTVTLTELSDLLGTSAQPSWEAEALVASAIGHHSAVLRELLRRGLTLGSCANKGVQTGEATGSYSVVQLMECAIEGGDIECARLVFSTHQRPGFDSRDTQLLRPLRRLVAHRYSRWLETFVSEFGCDVNEVDENDSRTPLICAAEINATGCTQELIRLGADVDRRKTQGGTATFYAALNGNIGCLRSLINANADVNLAVEKVKATPLFVAAQSGHLACVEALLEAGADVDAKFQDCATALYVAAQSGHHAIVKLLYERYNATADGEVGELKYNSAFAAAVRGHLETTQYLVEVAGVDVTMTATNGTTALTLAALGGFTNVMEYLLQPRFAELVHLEHAVPKDGSTALLCAVHCNQVEACKLLLEKGANSCALWHDKTNAVFQAAAQGNVEMLRLLLERKVPCNAKRATTNVTALHMAAQYNFPECPAVGGCWSERR